MNRRLTIEYGDLETLRREYHRNLANGGVFVATPEAFSLRELVWVDVRLTFCELDIPLEAEVVSVGAAREGGPKGVAVQFQKPAEELRQYLSDKISEVVPDALPKVWPKGTGLVRRDERSDARVRAILSSPLGMQDCMTRDLSRSGALIAIGAAPPPVGEAVNVTLAHPRTREELTLGARVVRHEKTGGRVGSVAVHFDVPKERRSWAIRFLEDIRATAKAKRRNAIQGPISVLGLANLVQMFSSAAECGTLIVKRGSEEGRVVFENGALRHARFGAVAGVKALSRLLSSDAGIFEFYGEVDPDEPDTQGGPMYGVVLEAMQYVDELRRIDVTNFPAQAVVRTSEEVSTSPTELDKLEATILGMSTQGTSVRALLDAVVEFDSEVYAALHNLLERGQIQLESR